MAVGGLWDRGSDTQDTGVKGSWVTPEMPVSEATQGSGLAPEWLLGSWRR